MLVPPPFEGDMEYHDSTETSSRQRLVVASQALEIQHLQDSLRQRERELSEKDAWYAKRMDEQARHATTLRERNEVLERDVLLLSDRLRGLEAEDSLANEDAGHIQAVSASSREKDALIKQLRRDVAQLRLELRTLTDEKSVLMNKVVAERGKNTMLQNQFEDVDSENVALRERCKALERAKHSLMVKLQTVELGGDNNAIDGVQYAPFREELRLPVSAGTQTTHEVLIPAVLDGAAPTKSGTSARVHVEGLRYLMDVEEGRVAFHQQSIAAHESNIKKLQAVIREKVESEMHRLRMEQTGLESLLETVGGGHAVRTSPAVMYEGSPRQSGSRPNEGLNQSGVVGTPYSTQLASESSRYMERQDHEMAGLRDRLKQLQTQHETVSGTTQQSRSPRRGVTGTLPTGAVNGSSILQRMLGNASRSDSRLRAL